MIRTKNEGEFIGETLRRIEEQNFSGNYEIIVVDSGSSDATIDIVRNHKVKLVEMPEKEFTYGRSLNIGASNAEGTFVVNLSAHALPVDREWLGSLIAGFENNKVAGTYGRQITDGRMNPFEARRNECFFGASKAKFNMTGVKRSGQPRFSNSNSSIKKEMWERFRFNEEVDWAEDMVWQREVMQAGFSIVYTPDAAVHHTHPVNIPNAFKTSKDCAVTLALMEHKRKSACMAVYDIAAFLALIPGSVFQDVKYIWQNDYRQYLGIAPLYTLSALAGWLVGRVRYRFSR
ncbi:MAG: glycosyltransferase [Thermodesulfobacteriota bacterium]|nr:glycosyltransferase [Thermodesulfobacteriota bacterium]